MPLACPYFLNAFPRPPVAPKAYQRRRRDCDRLSNGLVFLFGANQRLTLREETNSVSRQKCVYRPLASLELLLDVGRHLAAILFIGKNRRLEAYAT